MAPLSVLMPVFNGEEYLSAAVESVLSQTYRDFEFLIVDDGSTDSTLRILNGYASEDERLRIISREHKGLVASLNELLGYAEGRFIARMDADDISLPGRFSAQLRFLEENPDVVCVGGDYEAIDGDGRFLRTCRYFSTDDEIQELLLSGSTHICHSTAMMRKDAVVAAGGYKDEYFLAEDLDLWLRLGEVGKLANLGQATLRVRFHNHSLSEQSGRRQLEAARAACEHAWERRGIHGDFKGSLNWRPGGSDPALRHEHMLRYGEWAWDGKQRRTTALYAMRAIRERPAARGGWRLLARTLLRPFESDDQ